ncbi:glucoamylase family protein [Lysobacter sp. A03]|uniref:glucoamylase family protein n=1 Tax=Lysobacter sp. A03 TaxID=1199154 RepID=UPI0005B6C24B|nr:glucoamylase family protein [Lysobacter sp. A03]KIQ96546.1 hypothetical protein TI01_1995 [Lysobacter sp. A03]
MTDERLIDRLQRAAFGYFSGAFNPANGLVADTSRAGSPCSIAVVGFALATYPVAVERGWIGRRDAVQRALATLRFFHESDQSGAADATGHKGFYYHFLDMDSGTRMWRSELSTIDTALFIAGALLVARYFTDDTHDEHELRFLAHALYLRVDWQWACADRPTIRQGWKPECGFLHYGWDGYDEGILLYVLAAGSPTHPIDSARYAAWTATYQWENLYGEEFLYAGPMFVHLFSHAWIDFRGIRDPFMREKRSDYFENTRRAIAVQREYAWRNPHGFAGYGRDCWGLTACDGPDESSPQLVNHLGRLYGYAARGVPYGPDDGTLSAWLGLCCLPFDPAVALSATHTLLHRYPQTLQKERFASAFNPSLADDGGAPWVSAGTFGLDQGLVVMMVENHRTGLIWNLMRDCGYLRNGLKNAGFGEGWLE